LEVERHFNAGFHSLVALIPSYQALHVNTPELNSGVARREFDVPTAEEEEASAPLVSG
jgi:hypothetical protein